MKLLQPKKPDATTPLAGLYEGVIIDPSNPGQPATIVEALIEADRRFTVALEVQAQENIEHLPRLHRLVFIDTIRSLSGFTLEAVDQILDLQRKGVAHETVKLRAIDYYKRALMKDVTAQERAKRILSLGKTK